MAYYYMAPVLNLCLTGLVPWATLHLVGGGSPVPYPLVVVWAWRAVGWEGDGYRMPIMGARVRGTHASLTLRYTLLT